MGERWCVAASGVRLTPWEDGYTVFHAGSGDTHLLDPFVGQVLSCLLSQPMTLDELAQAMAGQGLADLGRDEITALEQALAALERVHLVESCR